MNKNDPSPAPLYIKLPQTNTYTKYFDSNNYYMNLLVHDKELLKKYNEIWDKVKDLFKKKFNSKQCIMINILKLK